MYLVDTNVWLERLLDQQRSVEAGEFLDRIPSDRLFITDFAFHSIAVILARLKQTDLLLRFVQDTVIDAGLAVLRLTPEDMRRLVAIVGQMGLDFDDAYQYVAAEKYNLTIISFDRDLDKTQLGRKSPSEVLE